MPEPGANALSATTRLCAVYGHPVRHSASPAMQNAGITALGLDWRYAAFDVRPEDLGAAIQGAAAMRFIGLNLTLPHKLLALSLMDCLDQTAVNWGAVNTVRFEIDTGDGHWRSLAELEPDAHGRIRAHGFNTDADALLRSLAEELDFRVTSATRVLLLGAGGAARVAALRLAAAGIGALYLINRTPEKAESIAAEIRSRFPTCTVETGYPHEPVDLILNGTSLGLKAGDPLPLDTNQFAFRETARVYDMIYRPAETPLLRLAREAGRRASNGLGMLLYQGARALEIWSGRPAPVATMREALCSNVYG